MIIAACEKETTPQENNITFTVNDKRLTIFEDTRLNKDTTGYFRFSFGTTVLTGQTDTAYTLQAVLNNHSISITFPQVDHPQKISLYKTDSSSSAEASFQYMNQSLDGALIVFYTNSFPYERNAYEQKVGEIDITRINNQTYEFEGSFWFEASGYKHQYTSGLISPTNESVNITQGEFYYHWLR